MNEDIFCPTCNLPYGFVRCKVTKMGFTQCLTCAVKAENPDIPNS